MEAKDTVLVGCEIICIGEATPPTDLIECPLSAQDRAVCRERRQYQAGEKAGHQQGVEDFVACAKYLERGRREAMEWYDAMLYNAFTEGALVALITDGSLEKYREHLIKYIAEKGRAQRKKWGL